MIKYNNKEYASVYEAAKANNQTSNYIEKNLDKEEVKVKIKKVKEVIED